MTDQYIWTTATGEQVNVRLMSDRHLSNTIRLMERKLKEVRADRDMIECAFQGEMSLDQINTDINTLEGKLEHTLLILRGEWTRRHQASKE